MVFIAAALLGEACGDDDTDRMKTLDIARNQAILDRLGTLPGSHALKTVSAPYYRNESGPPDGHTTSILYAAPEGASAETVTRFYARQLRSQGWKCELERIGVLDLGSAGRARKTKERKLILTCVRSKASASVNTDSITAASPRFEVVADHNGATNLGR